MVYDGQMKRGAGNVGTVLDGNDGGERVAVRGVWGGCFLCGGESGWRGVFFGAADKKLPAKINPLGGVMWIEHLTTDQKVVSSNPAECTILSLWYHRHGDFFYNVWACVPVAANKTTVSPTIL